MITRRGSARAVNSGLRFGIGMTTAWNDTKASFLGPGTEAKGKSTTSSALTTTTCDPTTLAESFLSTTLPLPGSPTQRMRNHGPAAI